MQNSVDSHSSTSQKPLQDKHRVISIALLDNHINMDLLRELSKHLQESFAYFEILILNPLFDMFDKNHKDTIKQQNPPLWGGARGRGGGGGGAAGGWGGGGGDRTE
uniref:hypothetical protein n=1 Tax=Helicobacter bilis TaxID=37372 RepID=UPI0026EB0F81